MKQLWSVQNLTLGIVVALGIQNVSLNAEISELRRDVRYLGIDTSDLEGAIEDMDRTVNNAAAYAEEAAEYAQEAAENAKNAYEYSFGYNCNNCP
jgi:methyl-accepting chemotaxis protein